jgi:hypothetical protein
MLPEWRTQQGDQGVTGRSGRYREIREEDGFTPLD